MKKIQQLTRLAINESPRVAIDRFDLEHDARVLNYPISPKDHFREHSLVRVRV